MFNYHRDISIATGVDLGLVNYEIKSEIEKDIKYGKGRDNILNYISNMFQVLKVLIKLLIFT